MLKNHGHKFVLSICGVLILVLCCMVYHSGPESTSDKMNMFLVGIGSIAMLYTGFVTAYMSYIANANTIAQKQQDATNNINNRLYDQNKNTQMLLLKFDDGVIYKARQFTREITTDKLGKEVILSRINEDNDDAKNLKDSVIMLFNYFDHIRIAIKMDIVNKEIIIDALGNTIIDICDKFEKWVDTKSQMRKDVDELLSLLKKK